ncbi:DUF1847 domain-containing protein [bacterium]|nr:DUF1847 domain-containing protein [bacterium]
MNCAECRQNPLNKCEHEGFDCTAGKLDISGYEIEKNIPFQNTSDTLRKEHGNTLTRLEEIIEFSKKSGYNKLGLVFCIGLVDEARVISRILKQHFRVASVCCKISGINKAKNNMVPYSDDDHIACNPIGQARMLNKMKTELNVQMGLCVGHDILFQQYSDAPVTVFAVKDRVLANNPLGVVYGSYLRDRFNIKN